MLVLKIHNRIFWIVKTLIHIFWELTSEVKTVGKKGF